MKKFLFLLLAALPLIFAGCSNNDDDDNTEEKKIKASVESVQGTWSTIYYDDFYRVTFTDTKYSFHIMDAASGKITHREHGTFAINEYKLETHTENKGRLNDAYIHFTDESKTTLYLSIAGRYTKSK